MGAIIEQGRRVARDVAWFVKGVMGEDAYEKYRAHYESTHGGEHGREHAADHAEPMMSEREFWRDRTDRQDAHPEGRCC
ncbi:MAG: hypothetical protein JWM50_641 [Microbacteriaceae bacterium]|jgi:uncharacterized short protein YbdD (DUF466 family)|nr:hypothetical protein [Microbacteriaceae bacterium]